MKVVVEVLTPDDDRPPVGTPLLVQVRDTALQDAPAPVLGESRGLVTESKGSLLAAVEVTTAITGGEPSVWAHVDVDRDGRVSVGDFITVQSYPVPRAIKATLRITLKKVT